MDYYRWNNFCDVEKYVDFWIKSNFSNFTEKLVNFSVEKIPQDEEVLTKEEKEFEFLMMGFRLKEGVKSSVYNSLFGKDLSTRLGYHDGVTKDSSIFNKWILANRAKVEKLKNGDFVFSLTDSGLIFLNQFLEEIL